MAQSTVGPPLLREFHGRPVQVSLKLFELRFQPGKKRKGICSRARETDQDPVVVHPPDLFGTLLDDRVAESHLTITGDGGAIAPFDEKNRGPMEYWIS